MSDFRMLPTHLEHLSATAEGDWSFAMMSAATAIPSKMARERYGQVTSDVRSAHFKEISEVTCKHSLLFQETEEKLLLLEHQVHSALLAMEQKFAHHEAQRQGLEVRLERLEGQLRVQSVASKSAPGSPQSIAVACLKELQSESAETPGAKVAKGGIPVKLPDSEGFGSLAAASLEKMQISSVQQEDLQSLRSKVNEICDKIHLQSDAASDERLLLEDVQKILVRLGSVEAQVSSCRQMFETSKAQEQQNLDRYGKLRKESSLLVSRLDMLEEHISRMESDQRKDVAFSEANSEQGDARRFLAALEHQLVKMSKDVVANVAQMKHLKTRLGGCEQMSKEVPTLRYSMEEAVRSAEIREAALFERLESVQKLATSLSGKVCMNEEHAKAKFQKHSNMEEDLRTVSAQQTAQVEVLRKELVLQGTHCSEHFADLQHRVSECNNHVGNLQQLLGSSDALKRSVSAISRRMAGIDLQISENKEQLLKSETEFRREQHTFQCTLRKHSDRVDGLEDRLVRCERLLRGPT